jgi:hypothetical protein
MISGIYLFILLVVVVIFIALAWRFATRHYTIPCPVWMKGLLDPPFSHDTSARTKKTIQRLDLLPGMNVLDAGCGPGRLTLPIASEAGPQGELRLISRKGCLMSTGTGSQSGPDNYPFSPGGSGRRDAGAQPF